MLILQRADRPPHLSGEERSWIPGCCVAVFHLNGNTKISSVLLSSGSKEQFDLRDTKCAAAASTLINDHIIVVSGCCQQQLQLPVANFSSTYS